MPQVVRPSRTFNCQASPTCPARRLLGGALAKKIKSFGAIRDLVREMIDMIMKGEDSPRVHPCFNR